MRYETGRPIRFIRVGRTRAKVIPHWQVSWWTAFSRPTMVSIAVSEWWAISALRMAGLCGGCVRSRFQSLGKGVHITSPGPRGNASSQHKPGSAVSLSLSDTQPSPRHCSFGLNDLSLIDRPNHIDQLQNRSVQYETHRHNSFQRGLGRTVRQALPCGRYPAEPQLHAPSAEGFKDGRIAKCFACLLGVALPLRG